MTSATGTEKRSIWLRGLLILVMALAFHVSAIVLGAAAMVQFVVVLTTNHPNERLVAFSRSLGAYLKQIASYVCFATEDKPFPFTAWPADA